MKKRFVFIVIMVLLIIILALARLGFNGGEDSWIKDPNGIWIKHGNPSSIPENVALQQEAIKCSALLHYKYSINETQFDSQCLGSCGNYAVDIVHVPRITADNEVQNQCSDFREEKVTDFIELDKDGNIMRIVD
jgi:hypothetical protein